MNYDSIIFDMDGTLWNTEKQVCAAWNKVLEDAGHPKRVSEDEIKKYMGLPMNEIGMKLFKTDNYDEVAELFGKCMDYENRYIAACGGVLYQDLIRVLRELSERVPLYIVSNCQSGYIEAFFEAHKTAEYFRDYLCYGDTGQLKDRNIRTIIKRNNLVNPVYVGDTQGDADAAAAAGVDFVWASYGFGKADGYVRKIDSFPDILTL